MAITPDVTTVTVDGVVIGLSETIGDLIESGDFTPENLAPYMFCGNNTIGTTRYGSLTGAMKIYTGSSASQGLWFPVVCTTRYGAATVEYALNDDIALENQCYGRNILVYGESPTSEIHSGHTESTLRVVTSVDFQKLYYDVELSADTISSTRPTAETKTYYKSGSAGKVKTITNNADTSIYVYDIFVDELLNEWYCILDYHFPGSDTANHQWKMCPTQKIEGNYGAITSNLYDGWSSFALTRAQWRWGPPSAYTVYGGENQDWGEGHNFDAFVDLGGNSFSYCDYDPYRAYCTCYICGLDNALKQVANAGLRFKYNNTWYKPIGQGGVITGYTDDMTEESEWDDIEDVTGNTVPVTPPGPTPPGPGPYDDDPWNGVSFSGVGVGGAGAFAKCYYMTSTELANLRSWMNSNNVPEGFDPMAQIIGLSQVPVSLSGDDNDTVQFVNSSAVYDPGVTRVVDSGVNTQIAMGIPIRYSLGSVDIVRRMQERGEPYLDYDCQIELYLPLIGMFSLDTQAVMGRTITAEAVLDPISGTLAAYAYVSRDGQNLPIAYGSTTIGVDLPISAQQYSVSRAALKQANAQLGASILSSTLSFIAAATAGGKGSGTGAKTATGTTNGLAAAGIREAGADYMKASQAGNVFGDFMQWGRTIRQLSYGNNTAIAGSFGGSTAQWAYPFTPYVKIIRPRYEKPSNYAHSQGVPCVQTKKVGDCTGFIQCIGVDVSGITRATDLERQAIQAALANGVFAGGGA